MPCQCHHAALGPTLVEPYGVELCHMDVPAWVSTSSGTFAPRLIAQDRMALNLQGTTVTLLINMALETLLCYLDPEQGCTSGSFCQTHPNHPRSPACLGLSSTISPILLSSHVWKEHQGFHQTSSPI